MSKFWKKVREADKPVRVSAVAEKSKQNWAGPVNVVSQLSIPNVNKLKSAANFEKLKNVSFVIENVAGPVGWKCKQKAREISKNMARLFHVKNNLQRRRWRWRSNSSYRSHRYIVSKFQAIHDMLSSWKEKCHPSILPFSLSKNWWYSRLTKNVLSFEFWRQKCIKLHITLLKVFFGRENSNIS